jgi:lysine 6-dehydrogenase
MSWAVLGKVLSEGDPHDVTVMRVIARSETGEFVYDMVDRYDDKEEVTSMGKTTGYTASIVAQMVGEGRIKGKGTLAPEKAVEGPLVETLLSELGRRGVSITSRRHGSP